MNMQLITLRNVLLILAITIGARIAVDKFFPNALGDDQ